MARLLSGEVLAIDWAADSAFRFFPIVQDPLLGWRLHHFDAATNKALTLAARTETRDYIDILELHRQFPLAAICWAACGKDPGFTPLSLLSMMRRFARVDRQPNVPIGVAFIDASGVPRWIGDDATLRVNAPSVRGCWPQVYELDARDH